MRFFIDAFTTKIFPHAGSLFVYGGGSPDAFVEAVMEIQELLQLAAKFAVGDHFTIAGAAVAPFFTFWHLFLPNDLGKFPEGTGPRLYEELFIVPERAVCTVPEILCEHIEPRELQEQLRFGTYAI